MDTLPLASILAGSATRRHLDSARYDAPVVPAPARRRRRSGAASATGAPVATARLRVLVAERLHGLASRIAPGTYGTAH